jgi:hypothetical protein
MLNLEGKTALRPMAFVSRIVIEDCSGQQGNEHLTYSCNFRHTSPRLRPPPGKSSALMKPEEEEVWDIIDI